MSQHTVGVIPISLDRTPLGSMAMSRRRDLKCLILLGATDENMPSLKKGNGTLSDNERAELSKLGTEIPAGFEERLYREMNMLYSTLTLPSEKLVMIYPTGTGERPSFVIKRLFSMFKIQESTMSHKEYMSAAEAPYLEYLYSIEKSNTFITRDPLSKHSANNLYGENVLLSATRVDRFYSCPYMHFLQNGLRLEPRRIAEFDASSAGIFIHYVLDGVFSEIKGGVGFKHFDETLCQNLTEKYIEKFVHEVLQKFDGKSARFEYLFRRYETDVFYVLRDMLNELKYSKFEPFDLELDMSELSETERGFIDRVDGFKHKDRLFLRVIDYKTRKKAYSFDLSDVFSGRDMQMLIYLFALQKYGSKRYDQIIEPAGVLYAPARDVIINMSRNASDEEIEKKRETEMRRSGVILNDSVIIEAMESGETKKYLPVKTTRDGTLSGDSLLSNKQFMSLSKHVEYKLNNAKEKILRGDNECTPYYKNTFENACAYCDYASVCLFDEEQGDKLMIIGKKTSEEIWQELGVRS